MSRQKTKTHKDLIHEIRDPIHGFIKLNDLEKEIIDSIEFQRLHKIHHLALTYQIYPSATHKRFSHSLGAMSFASQIFDILKAKIHYRCNNSKSKYDKTILEQYLTDKNWQILRLTGLLHILDILLFLMQGKSVFQPIQKHKTSISMKHILKKL